MAKQSLHAAVAAYMTRHLGEQYTAAQVTVYHHGQRVLSQSFSIPTPPETTQTAGTLGTALGLSLRDSDLGTRNGASATATHTHPVYFDLASLTKLFTTTAILQAVSAGKLALTTPVAEIIPEFAVSGGRTIIDDGVNPHTHVIEPPNRQFAGQTIAPASVTIWHLLTHTSGLAPWRKLYDDDAPPPPPTQPDPIPRHERWARALKQICESPFIAPAGHAVRYSDLGFMLLGEVVARTTAAPHPLSPSTTEDGRGVTSLSSLITGETRSKSPSHLMGEGFRVGGASSLYSSLITHHSSLLFAPTEYDARWRKRRIWGEVHDENACGVGGVAGHAGLFGTADTLAAFGAMWCAQTVPDLAPDLARDAVRVHAQTVDERRGLGWMVRSLGKSTAGTKFGANSYGHTGFVGNMLWVDPDQSLVVCCLTNNVYYGRGKTGLFEFRVGLNDLIWEALCSS